MEIVKTIKFKNASGDRLKIAEPFDCEVKPGGEIDVPEVLCRPRRLGNGGRGPSVIEQLAPQMKPSDKAYLEEWEKAPPEVVTVVPGSKPASLNTLLAAGVPRGVAEALVQAQAAKAQGKDEG